MPEKYTVVYSHYNKRSDWKRIQVATKEEGYQTQSHLEQCGYYVRGVFPEYKNK